MARPKAKVIVELRHDNIITELLAVKGVWALTYKEELFNHRFLEPSIRGMLSNYGKTFYTNYGNALAQARNLNNRFNCLDFAVKQIYGE